jgi:hypothetical protein
MVAEVSIGPIFPRRAIVDREFVWDFMTTQQCRGGGFFPRESLRRTNDGVLGRNGQEAIGDLTQHGFIFWKTALALHQKVNGDNTTSFWDFGSILRPTLKTLVWATRFYAITHYRGGIQIDGSIALFVGEAVGGRRRSEEKSQGAGLFHLAWKSRKSFGISTSPTAPATTTASQDFDFPARGTADLQPCRLVCCCKDRD